MECGFIQCDTSGGLEGLFVQFHNQWTFALGTLVPLESGERSEVDHPLPSSSEK